MRSRRTRHAATPDPEAVDLKSLRHFVAVAEAGGFRRAGELHGVLQSVLSRKVRELEDRLGVSLLERHREGVRLTNAGGRFLKDARSILAHLERATISLGAAGSAREGHLAVGVASSMSRGFLHDLIQSWRSSHPHVAMRIREGTPRELVAAVVQRDLDVTFTAGSPAPQSCGTEQLWTDRIFLAAGSDNPLSARVDVSVDDLCSQNFIVSQGGSGHEIRDFLVTQLSSRGVSSAVETFEVGREALFAMVGMGFGCAVAAAPETGVAYPDVTYVPIRDVELPFGAVWCRANDNPALRRFLSEARTLSRAWRTEASKGALVSADHQ